MLATVETASSDYCAANRDLPVTTADQTVGYLASIMTSDVTQCDGRSHPWLIAAQVGQRISLTLFDFTVEISSRRLQIGTE